MTEIALEGCRPEPLASYLKALSVLRIVSEQKDPDAKGHWKDGVFHLNSSLDMDSLVDFFSDAYMPTPIVSPWNGGSGFYEGDSVEARDAILSSTKTRFDEYRRTINAILSWPEMPRSSMTVEEMIQALDAGTSGRKGAAKDKIEAFIGEIRKRADEIGLSDEGKNPLSLTVGQFEKLKAEGSGTDGPKKALSDLVRLSKKARTVMNKFVRDERKHDIVRLSRNRLGPRTVEWVDAAIVMGKEEELVCPPLLVSGGNEGRLEYSKAFMTSIRDVMIEQAPEISRELLKNAIFGDSTSNLVAAPVGQLDPGRAGGFNQGAGIEQKDFPVNPWDFILAMEGSVAWAGSVARRQSAGGERLACSPFTVRQSSVGYSSASPGDDAASKGEIWVPVWGNPTGYPELRLFLAEGRAEIGRKNAGTGVEFAEAVTSLGVDRGVSEFVRFALLKRRGDNLVAVPLSHFPAGERRETDLIRQLGPLLGIVDGYLRSFSRTGAEIPARLASARRGVDEAIFDVLVAGGKGRMKMLLAAIGRLERLITAMHSERSAPSRPVQGLGPEWVKACDDGTVEVRIAASVASIQRTGGVGPMRANLAPVDPVAPWKWARGGVQTAWEGNSLSSRLMSVLIQRSMDYRRHGPGALPFFGRLAVRPDDVAAFIDGDVDDSLIEDLLFGFTWLDWTGRGADVKCRELNERWRIPVSERPVPWSWAQLKLLFMPGPVRTREGALLLIAPEPAVVPLLKAGRVSEACDLAQTRLFASGLTPLRASFPDVADAERVGAALLIPVQAVSELLRMATGGAD